MGVCCVPGCSHRTCRERCSFLRFPRNPEENLKWRQLCRRADSQDPKGHDRICSCHFKNNKRENGPTIFPWTPQSTLDPLEQSRESSVTKPTIQKLNHPLVFPKFGTYRSKPRMEMCAVLNCRNRGGNPGVSIFKFPKDRGLCGLWVNKVGRKDLRDRPLEKNHAHFALCSEHFEVSQFTNPNMKNKLKWDAVPTLFNASIPSSSVTLKQEVRCQRANAVPRPKVVIVTATNSEGALVGPTTCFTESQKTVANPALCTQLWNKVKKSNIVADGPQGNRNASTGKGTSRTEDDERKEDNSCTSSIAASSARPICNALRDHGYSASEPLYELADVIPAKALSSSKARELHCSALECSNVLRKDYVSFFPFPKPGTPAETARCQRWVTNMLWPNVADQLPTERALNSWYRLCADHFDDSQFVNPKTRTQLKPDAVPTLFDLQQPPTFIDPFRVKLKAKSSPVIRDWSEFWSRKSTAEGASVPPFVHYDMGKRAVQLSVASSNTKGKADSLQLGVVLGSGEVGGSARKRRNRSLINRDDGEVEREFKSHRRAWNEEGREDTEIKQEREFETGDSSGSRVLDGHIEIKQEPAFDTYDSGLSGYACEEAQTQEPPFETNHSNEEVEIKQEPSLEMYYSDAPGDMYVQIKQEPAFETCDSNGSEYSQVGNPYPNILENDAAYTAGGYFQTVEIKPEVEED